MGSVCVAGTPTRDKKKRAELRRHGLPMIWKDGKVREVPA
jgi:hypothetical protein